MPPKIRPNVLEMQPYSPGRPIAEVQRELGLDDVIKLASNENPLGPSPKAVEALRKAADQLHLYPDAAAFELRAAISSHFNVAADQVVIGNGSDELITLLGQALILGPEDEVLVGDPSFVRYDAVAHVAPCRLVKVPVDAEMALDLEAMATKIGPNTRMIFLANPNNPTGTIYRKAAFDRFLSQVPESTTVVLDEAYCDFAMEEADYPHGLEYVATHPNVVVLRTLSKAYGLAGIRAGFMVASPEIADALNRIRAPFAVNALAQVAGIAALQDPEFLARSLSHNKKALATLSQALEAQGARVFPSYANFVLADMGEPAKPIFEALLRKGVIVRSGHVLGLPNCLRVSVGTDAEMVRFVEALEAVMQEKVTA